MKELSQLLIKAKEVKKYVDLSEFEVIIKKINNLNEYRLDWDTGAGEEWARFLNTNSEIILMFNVKIGIVFLRRAYASDRILNIIEELLTVEVDDFGIDEWCMDVSIIEKDLPEISWMASEEAVNTNRMSLQDLYYATI